MLCLCYLLYLRRSSSKIFAILVINFLSSLEAFARICVSGFLLDPEIPISTLFASPFSAHPETAPSPTSANPNSSIARQTSLSHPQGPLSRGLTLTQRLDRLNHNFMRPFSLATRSRASSYPNDGPISDNDTQLQSKTSITEKMMASVQTAHSAIRNPTQPTFFSAAMRSDHSDSISLPFRLSVIHAHDKTQRNVPYLRHSWSRIDFVAIVSFWVCFVLATMGLERGSHHIGLFRAMSVVRTARLLTITSGTTVSLSRHFYWCLSSLIFLVDNYALLEDGSSAAHQRCILCPFRHGSLLVS